LVAAATFLTLDCNNFGVALLVVAESNAKITRVHHSQTNAIASFGPSLAKGIVA
jgi:hypothetical protein